MPATAPHRPGWTLAAASTVGYLLVLDFIGVNVALPDMQHRLHAELAEVQWSVDAYALPIAALVMTAGALADRLGRRRLFLLGLAVFTAASLACALAPSVRALDASRAAQGCGAAMLLGTLSPLVAAAYPEGRERNGALGVLAAAMGGAIATGPLVGGVLTELFGWRAIFLLNVPFGALALAIAVRTLRESRDPRPRPLDLRSTAFLTVGLTSLIWALIDGHRAGWATLPVAASLALAAAAFTALTLRRPSDAMIDLSLLRNRLYTANALGALVIHLAGPGSLTYFSLYVQGPMGARPAEAGAWLLAYSVPALTAPLLLGRISHRFPPAALVALGPVLTAAACLLLAATYRGNDWTAMLPAFVVGGLGLGIGNLVSSQTALAAAPPERAGTAAGIANTAKQLGTTAGVALLGIPYGLHGLGLMLVITAGLSLLGAIPALRLWARPPRHTTHPGRSEARPVTPPEETLRP